jgi:hypothetical protein
MQRPALSAAPDAEQQAAALNLIEYQQTMPPDYSVSDHVAEVGE